MRKKVNLVIIVLRIYIRSSSVQVNGHNTERSLPIDVLRGISIFGILMVNMLSFHSPILYVDPLEFTNTELDLKTYQMIDIFFQASFYPLFSFLFGFSLFLLKRSIDRRGLPFHSIATRRFVFLFIIGIVHAFFIWHGDILINYSILAFLLLAMVQLSGRTLLKIGISLLIIPNVLITLLLFAAEETLPTEGYNQGFNHKAEEVTEIYKNGSYWEVTIQRFQDWSFVNNVDSILYFIISIFPMFILGAAFYKFSTLDSIYRPQWIKVMVILGVIGVVIKSSPYILGHRLDVEYAQDMIGGPILSLFYIFSIYYLCSQFPLNKIWTYLQNVGKMSITNYLFQSVVLTFIFYGYGLGFYGEISIFHGTILAILVFILQILMSHLWLQKYDTGPVEWLWRGITYKKFLKNQKGNE